MAQEGYMTAWLVYSGAALVILAVIWWLTATWRLWLKAPLRALLIAVLFTPWLVSTETDSLAPAWVIMLFDSLIQADAEPMRAGAPLLAACVVALALAAAFVAVRRRFS